MAVICNCFILCFGYFSVEVVSKFTDKLEFIPCSCLEFLTKDNENLLIILFLTSYGVSDSIFQ